MSSIESVHQKPMGTVCTLRTILCRSRQAADLDLTQYNLGVHMHSKSLNYKYLTPDTEDSWDYSQLFFGQHL